MKLRDGKPYKIDDEKLMAYLHKTPDHYVREIAVFFHVRISAVFYALKRMRISYTKNVSLPPGMRKKPVKNFINEHKSGPAA